MGILNIGAQALQANLVALQTTGNNIANVNTAGYSRQKVVLQTVAGQFTGGGYLGKGVSIQTIQRNFDSFLNRQSTLASTTQAADVTRANYLTQLTNIFQGGTDGVGASINDMLNAFSDVASAPTDLTARTVALTRVDETARRLRSASQSLDDLQSGIAQSIGEKVTAINTLAHNIADVNEQISRAQGNGQPPNDLLDRRDQLIRDLNQYVQTTSIPADDGTVGVFIGGSQALVLGTEVAPVSIVPDDFGDTLKSRLAITRNGSSMVLDENTLGGGEVSGLLRFQNNDLAEGRNLLGRLTMGITTAMNDQHKLGLDLDGNVGGNLFTPTTFGSSNIYQATGQTSAASMTLSIADVTQLEASDYEINFTTPPNASVKRMSDGLVRTVDLSSPVTLDGLTITTTGAAGATAGDRFLLKPYSTSASNVAREFSTPRALAVAAPLAATLTPTNTGSLALASLSAKTLATTAATVPQPSYTVTFTNGVGGTTYDIVDNTGLTAGVTGQSYVSGQAINYTPAGFPGFSMTLTGSPATNDTVTIGQNAFAATSGGNASAMMDLRDKAMFDGAALTDGYAGLISQIGIRSQSANYSAQVSSNIATNAEKDRSGVSGVNLDEEAAKLLQYQQAYQASAKMIQIAQSIFDTLIQGLSR
ncbi:flagellar hook-associated protein FlgK [Rhodoferax saidenbachensis]|uniref:Flagellar hook-associated protein 1 n=1 Tax=Rhodoferax saidenbachensis TaxID=1484693 RepID=A0ABU1ZUN9_9BURK|nr:flagellar hook-associated protein FlgK [Rhodoferax saidenbachensis]MDR7308560.1 flagellar hook-associated protein 1 FlgK [Rhodoferax saidenbachensis]